MIGSRLPTAQQCKTLSQVPPRGLNLPQRALECVFVFSNVCHGICEDLYLGHYLAAVHRTSMLMPYLGSDADTVERSTHNDEYISPYESGDDRTRPDNGSGADRAGCVPTDFCTGIHQGCRTNFSREVPILPPSRLHRSDVASDI